MSKYLEEKCVNLGIRLVYTYNKSTVLSVEIQKEKPLLIADMLFKNCPDSVTQAIIGFFTDKKNKNIHEQVIRNFVEEYFKPYKPGNIKHFDLSYLVSTAQAEDADYKWEDSSSAYNTEIKDSKLIADSENTNYNIKHDSNKSDWKPEDRNYTFKYNSDNYDVEFNSGQIDVNDPNLVEFNIYKINSKDPWGDEKQYTANTSIKPLKDDELKLNIIVLPPGT